MHAYMMMVRKNVQERRKETKIIYKHVENEMKLDGKKVSK